MGNKRTRQSNLSSKRKSIHANNAEAPPHQQVCNTSGNPTNPYSVKLLNEDVPDDKSLTIKLEFDVNPDTPTPSEYLDPIQIKCETESDVKPEPISTDIESVDVTDNENDDADEIEEDPYISRIDKVLNMDKISKSERTVYYEILQQELVAKAEKYDFKEELPDPECLYEFFFFPSLTPPIDLELRKRKFSEKVGPINNFTPYEAFTAIWNETVLEHIVRETNNNAKQFNKRSKWIDTNTHELYVFFAITLATSELVDLSGYWTCSTETPNFSQAMSYSRFVMLNKFLSFTDWNMELYKQPRAKLFKIKPLIDHLNRSFSSLFLIGQDVVFDEPSIAFESNGRLIILKNKCGMKEIDIVDAKTGYVWKVDILVSESETSHGIPPSFILNNLEELENKGYTIWSDNIFNSFLLTRILHLLGFNAVGTLRLTDILELEYSQPSQAQLKTGDLKGCTSGDLDFIAWRDKKLITFVTSYHGKTTITENGKVNPAAFVDYMNNVASSEKRDQILAAYNCGVRGRNWIRKMFRRLLNISVYNSLILYKSTTEHSADSYKQFVLELIRQLVTRHGRMNTLH